MFEEYQPLVEKLVDVQRKLATQFLAEAKQKITEGMSRDGRYLETRTSDSEDSSRYKTGIRFFPDVCAGLRIRRQRNFSVC